MSSMSMAHPGRKPRAVKNQDPTKFYTVGEEICNAVTHGIGTVLGLAATGGLVTVAVLYADFRSALACFIYGLSLIALYTMSTLYHAFPQEKIKRVFRVFDHSTIYLLIAGTYTPMTLILLRGNPRGTAVCVAVWAAALVGIVLNCISIERFKAVSMVLYVTMGWAVLFVVRDVVAALPRTGLILLVAGGLCYTGGITFYALRRRWMHSVWHMFVLAGSVLHFVCVAGYVLPMALR